MYTALNNPLPKPVLTMNLDDEQGAEIVFYGNQSEMLKLTKTAFYVRGEPVPVDEQEAREVYQAFRQWLVWAGLTAQP